MFEASATSIDTADVLAIDAAIGKSTGSADFGLTTDGFVAKPYPRLLAEKLALARALFGEDLDLTSGSTIRKILEISALEDGRTWAALSTMYDNCFVTSATGAALTDLGRELGIERPALEAIGKIKLKLVGSLPSDTQQINIPRGARLSTPGGHHVATSERVVLSPASLEREVPVNAFYPGTSHNLDPTLADSTNEFPQKIDRWNRTDKVLAELDATETVAGAVLVEIQHTDPLSGGELFWPDARYRELLLRAPRSIWTVDAIQIAVSLVPGVRQVQVRDAYGGLDIHQSIFGNFNFIERVFGSERDLGSPYYFNILVAPTPSAIWEGPDGLKASVESAIEDLRPISIFPQVDVAQEIGVGVRAKLIVKGIPLPSGPKSVVNASEPARALKTRILVRLQNYIDGLPFGEPVRSSEVNWAIMNEHGVADIQDLSLVRYPPGFDSIDFTADSLPNSQEFQCGENVDMQVNQIPVFVDDDSGIELI